MNKQIGYSIWAEWRIPPWAAGLQQPLKHRWNKQQLAGKNLTRKQKPVLGFTLLLLAQLPVQDTASAKMKFCSLEFDFVWHGVAFFLFCVGDGFKFRADLDLE